VNTGKKKKRKGKEDIGRATKTRLSKANKKATM
jgi:hypothetical protein